MFLLYINISIMSFGISTKCRFMNCYLRQHLRRNTHKKKIVRILMQPSVNNLRHSKHIRCIINHTIWLPNIMTYKLALFARHLYLSISTWKLCRYCWNLYSINSPQFRRHICVLYMYPKIDKLHVQHSNYFHASVN